MYQISQCKDNKNVARTQHFFLQMPFVCNILHSLKHEIDFLGPMKLCDIEKAQVEITKIIRQLEKDGKIVICKDRDEEE